MLYKKEEEEEEEGKKGAAKKNDNKRALEIKQGSERERETLQSFAFD